MHGHPSSSSEWNSRGHAATPLAPLAAASDDLGEEHLPRLAFGPRLFTRRRLGARRVAPGDKGASAALPGPAAQGPGGRSQAPQEDIRYRATDLRKYEHGLGPSADLQTSDVQTAAACRLRANAALPVHSCSPPAGRSPWPPAGGEREARREQEQGAQSTVQSRAESNS